MTRPNVEIAKQLAFSCVQFSAAGAALVNRVGELKIHSVSAAQESVQKLADVFLGWLTVSFEAATGGSTHVSFVASRSSTGSQPECRQVTGLFQDPSCVCQPYGAACVP